MPDRPGPWSSSIGPGREPATGPTPGGQQAGAPGQAAEGEADGGREANPFTTVRAVHLGMLQAGEASPGACAGVAVDILHRATPSGP